MIWYHYSCRTIVIESNSNICRGKQQNLRNLSRQLTKIAMYITENIKIAVCRGKWKKSLFRTHRDKFLLLLRSSYTLVLYSTVPIRGLLSLKTVSGALAGSKSQSRLSLPCNPLSVLYLHFPISRINTRIRIYLFRVLVFVYLYFGIWTDSSLPQV